MIGLLTFRVTYSMLESARLRLGHVDEHFNCVAADGRVHALTRTRAIRVDGPRHVGVAVVHEVSKGVPWVPVTTITITNTATSVTSTPVVTVDCTAVDGNPQLCAPRGDGQEGHALRGG